MSIVRVLVNRVVTALAAGVATDILGASGLSVQDYPSLSILIENSGANPVTDIAFYWSNDPDADGWSARDKSIPVTTVAAGDSVLIEFGNVTHYLMRIVVTSTAGTSITTTIDARDDVTGSGVKVNGVVVSGGSVTTAGADGQSNTRNSLATDTWINAFNGTTWDRIRAIGSTLTATLTGLLSTLPRAIYNAAPTARTEGQSGPVQAAANGSLLTSINDGVTQNNVAVSTAGSDGSNNTSNRLDASARVSGYNGATWDRLRAGVTTLSATFTGMLNTLPWAVYNASPTTRTEGQGGQLQADSLGNLNTTLATLISGEDTTNNVLGALPKPVVSSTYSWTRYAGFPASAVTANVKASAGQLFSLYCHNLNAAARYIQIHNTATTPAGGATPIFSFLVPAGGTVLIDSSFFGGDGNYFATGIAFAFSTTENTYTAGVNTDCIIQIMYA